MWKSTARRGFTLVELMVVIVIVALMATVAVPIFVNYTKDARRSEAANGLAAIATAQQSHYQRYGAFANALASLNVDLADMTANWSFADPTLITGPPVGFSVVANGKSGTACSGLSVTMTYTVGGGKSLVGDDGKAL